MDTMVSVLGFNISSVLLLVLISKVLFARFIIELFFERKQLPSIPFFLIGKCSSTKLNSVFICCPWNIKGMVNLPNVCIILSLIPLKFTVCVLSISISLFKILFFIILTSLPVSTRNSNSWSIQAGE